jgi:hypothetical protein
MNGFSNGAPQPDPDFNPIRGETEWGVRLGCSLGQLQGTLNYMSVYNDGALWDFFGAPEQPMTGQGTSYPEVDVYAATLTYAIAPPINTVMTFEISYTPDQPWQSTAPGPPSWDEGAFTRAALYMERNTFFMNRMSRYFYPGKVGFMYYRHWISDGSDLKLTPAPLDSTNRLDFALDVFYLSYTLGWGEGKSWEINPKCYWNPEGGYKLQCFLKYSPNYDWRFDLGGMWQGGSSDHNFTYAPSGWNDEIYMRATFMF